MAEIEEKYEDNVTGKFFVDEQCIDCDLCRETAPSCFTRNDDGGYSFVHKQPDNEEEEVQCREAMEGCPVEAIGDNGAGYLFTPFFSRYFTTGVAASPMPDAPWRA